MNLKLEAKSRIKKIFNSYNTYEDYYLKVYEIDNNYFHEQYKEKIQVDKNSNEYILLKIDISFSEYNLVVDIEEKDRDKDLNFKLKKSKKFQKKNSIIHLLKLIQIMIQIMKLATYKNSLMILKILK